MSEELNGWRSIKRLPRRTSEGDPVDIWMHVIPSPRSMGMGDSWRIVDCWLEDGRWFHRHENEIKQLNADCVTHWMYPPKPPKDLARRR